MPAVLARTSGVRLLVAGRDGNQTPLLRAAVHRLGLEPSVTFLGARDDVADLLCAADAVVIPSRWEGLSNVLIEAMALEAPVVASARPGHRNVTLNRAAFNLGQLVAAGLLDVEEVRSVLLAAALEAGNPKAKAMATIASGLRGGAAKPRRRRTERHDRHDLPRH